MRNRVLLSVLFIAFSLSCATSGPSLKKPGCADLYFDVYSGTLNGLKPTATQAEVKKQFPCFTGDTVDGSSYNCGGGVFFLKHDFYFYTHADYLNVRRNFKGKVSDDLLGRTRYIVAKRLGQPIKSDKSRSSFYKMPYGVLVVQYENNLAIAFEAFFKPIDQIKLCR